MKPIEDILSNPKLLNPVDLFPGIGFLTFIGRVGEYNFKTNEIRNGTAKKNCMVVAGQNPDTRDMKRSIVGGLLTYYHVAAGIAIMEYSGLSEALFSYLLK